MRMLITFTAALAISTICFSQEPAKIKKVDITYTQPSSGAAMFKQYCAACHGATQGNGPSGFGAEEGAADLTLLSKKNNGKYPTLQVQSFIRGDSAAAAHGTRTCRCGVHIPLRKRGRGRRYPSRQQP